jgi:hypothetical protein
MTFISAFRCNGGVVIGADSQESYGDYKLTADKLSPAQSGDYELAMGGAGLGDLVDSLFAHLQEWVAEWNATSEKEILKLLRPRLREFYLTEVAAYPDKRVNKRITAVLCLKHKSKPDILLFDIAGSTAKKAGDFSLGKL